MEPILEEADSERSLNLDLNNEIDPKRDLAFKAGFLSLQERLSNWKRQFGVGDIRDHHHERTIGQGQQRGQTGAGQQFANLYEFFQSKTSFKKQLEHEAQVRASKRPKIPVMKLSKEDWNVKCWEQRSRPYRDQLKDLGVDYCSNNRLQKPELQVSVFNGRVDEVADKLEKVRVGQPLDELLYKLETNKLRDHRREHSWTDQLKQELSHGTHDRKRLKSKIIEQTEQQDRPARAVRGGGGDQEQDNKRVVQAKSVLGRPIRRLFDDDDDD